MVPNSTLVQCCQKKIQKCSEEIATAEPHVDFAAFTHGGSARWQYFSRVIDISSITMNDQQSFHQLEEHMHHKLIPALTEAKHLTNTTRTL